MLRRILLPLLLVFALPSLTLADQSCIYRAHSGEMRQVGSIHQVPNRYRSQAQCSDTSVAAPSNHLARPQDIELEGNLRREDMSSSIGRIQLRWPRSVETLFGKNPLRATAESAQVVSRALRTAAFSTPIQSLNLDWQIVFMDANLPQAQIPTQLISNCHPGWMTPPANIYIVGQRVAAGCGGERSSVTSVADSRLAEVLVHEMGHAVEYHLLGDRPQFDRMRAEGFATWFEMHAAEYSSLISATEIRRRTHQLARVALQQSPDRFTFTGSGEDYARASMYFVAVVDKRGVRGLMEVYDLIRKEGVPFTDAIKKTMYWDDRQLAKEVERAVAKY
ncbi:MAG: hypothetical protein KDD69_02230 [Bdellovibrionales bacterium]|nr:hypothetical protein [Bdellovibrionales bacterium]